MDSSGRTGVSTRRTGSQTKSRRRKTGLKIKRVFTRPGVHPYDEIKWERRDAAITNDQGEVIFEQRDVEVPASWTMIATNVVVSKYFNGPIGSPTRETSVRHMIDRVTKTLSVWGHNGGYFKTADDAETFEQELTYILLHQLASFNSPVWFNMGVEEKPQCSACFINSVKDSMGSILDLAKTEGMLFKFGSGTGTNLSPIRSSKERLSSGGLASGPVSFMRGYDAFAGVIKSGGKTRRAAKMVILNAEHPDIIDFVRCKVDEEKKAWDLMDIGYDGSFGGPAYSSVFFQNSNNSVRVKDDFMEAVAGDREWSTRAVTNGEIMDTYRAKGVMGEICKAAHTCGDPGLQFDTTINKWHTCKGTAPINSSNPCSEYMFLDDTACNLASVNLMKFKTGPNKFNVASFRHTCRTVFIGMEIIVGNASYPSEKIAENSHLYRPLGLGYANLGALLMDTGLPYDSDQGRNYAGALTAIMTGEAYRTSAELAKVQGPFDGYATNEKPMLDVMNMHRDSVKNIDAKGLPDGMVGVAQKVWDEALELGKQNGFRNSQATVIAPTGTIGLMMDCDTTGIEPDIALVKYKKLVDGGLMKIVNQTVPSALTLLGYDDKQVEEIVSFIDANDTIEGCPHLTEDHFPVFDCAFRAMNGTRSIHHMAHIKMMAAVQPFISGAISKTVNMPPEATVEEIEEAYLKAWDLGLKAIAIYRDGSKRTQPLNTSLKAKGKESSKQKPKRRRLEDERRSITHKFSIAGHEGYITVGMYEDGSPGEIFVTMAKEGSVISGLMDTIATNTSIALQYGVPLKVLVNKFSHVRFEPAGFTKNREIPIAKSVIDYIFRWLGMKFLPVDQKESALTTEKTSMTTASESERAETAIEEKKVDETLESGMQTSSIGTDERQVFQAQADAPPCSECGSMMVRSGSCYRCLNCGSTSGCS